MLRDVNVTIEEGGMISDSGGVGVHVKIGASPKVSVNPITIKGNHTAEHIQQALGSCPLADACMDSVDNGSSLIYCIPVAPSVEGTTSAVVKTSGDEASTGTVALAGKPCNAYALVLEVMQEGALNEAGFRWSLNDGRTWSGELTVPLGGTLELTPTGLTVTFTPGAAGYKAKDTFKATTTAPTLNNQDVLGAIDKLRTLSVAYEFVHVVGGSTKALWAAAAVKATELETRYKLPLFFVFETAYPPAGTVQEYADALLAPTAINSRHVQVSSHFGLYTRMDGSTQVVNLAGITAGLYARAKVHQSLGEVISFPITETKLHKLLPEGIDDYTSDLDDVGYLTYRRYYNIPEFYVNNARMMTATKSDFKYAEFVRVANKASRGVRLALVQQLHRSLDLSNLDSELAAIAEFAKTPLDDMIAAGEMSSARVVIPSGQDILSKESLDVTIRFVPRGYAREFNVSLAMENPFKGGTSA